MVQRKDFRVVQVPAPLRQSVVGSIRDAILTGHYLSGERLPEKDLCDLTGVSRTLVREALRQLEAEKLVEVIPNRGPYVVTISAEVAKGIYQVREALEGLAAELFAKNASDADCLHLEDALEALKKAILSKEPLEVLRKKEGFYDSILRGAGNPALTTALQVINGQIRLLQSSWQRDAGRDEDIVTELEDVVKALVARDADNARRLSIRHVRNASKVALERLKVSEPRQRAKVDAAE